MTDEAKELIEIHLQMLKKTLIDNNISIGISEKQRQICFFDTHTYTTKGKISGITVNIDDLVK